MATRVFLVRHGSTVLTAEDRFAGSTDVALSDEGRRQASSLAERLKEEPLVAFYCSPLQRARDTAQIIAAPHSLPVAENPAFREIEHGHWEGKTRAEVDAQFPEEARAWQRDPFTYAPPGGETGLAVTARALPALLALVGQHARHSILLVSHKATIRLLLSSLLGFDARRYRDNLDQSPAALNIIDFQDPYRARLTLFNDTSHYTTPSVPPIPGERLSGWWSQKEEPE